MQPISASKLSCKSVQMGINISRLHGYIVYNIKIHAQFFCHATAMHTHGLAFVVFLSVCPPVKRVYCDKTKLENVAIANALQLEAARRRAVPIPFSFVSRAKFELAQPIRCRLRAF